MLEDRRARLAPLASRPWASLWTLATVTYVSAYLAYLIWSESPGWEPGRLVRGALSDLGYLPANLMIAAVFWWAANRAAREAGAPPALRPGRHTGTSRMLSRALRLVALQSMFTAVGDMAWWYVDIVQGRDPVNSWANAIYLASYVVMLAALVSMPRGRRAKLEWWKFALDAATVLLGGAIVIGVIVLWPRASGHPAGGTLSLALAYPLADLLMLLGITAVALRPTGRPPAPLIVLLVSQLACIASDVLYTIVFLRGTGPDLPSTPVWSTALLGASYVLLMASGEWYRHAPATELPDPNGDPSGDRADEIADDAAIESMHPTSPLPYIASAGATALVVFLAWQSRPDPLSVLVLAIVPVYALLAVRGVVSSRQNVALLTESAARTAESRLRSRLHGQLVHAQRMEAVGQLAGGVAHDFNNILTAISGNAELAMESLPPNAAARDDLREIRAGVMRASTLTRQLLAFSRRQTLHAQVVDLNAIVNGCEPMLARLIGEHVHLDTHLANGVSAILADPGQIEQVLVNLVVNARDAMPNGGRVSVDSCEVVIATANPLRWPGLAPGRYVRLSVRDTGTGMDGETRKRAFEPFYTTKAQGKGTGLGLATVYGIVTQSEGSIFIDSEPGRGTTVAAYFRPTTAKASVPPSPSHDDTAVAAKGETILVVEDESTVREPMVRALRQHGYVVLEATDGLHGLEVSEQHRDTINLVVSDVRMPRLTGPAMIERLRHERPGLRAIFVSGYASLDRGVRSSLSAADLLEKPFTMPALFRRVREALDCPAPGYTDGTADATADATPHAMSAPVSAGAHTSDG